MINELMNWFASLSPKTQEEKKPPSTYKVVAHEYPRCYKYCVDTHKYNIIGNVIDGEVVFGKAYPLKDTHMFRAYQYAFFIEVENNYRTFIPTNVVRQIPYDGSTSYVIGYMSDKDEVFYYDQYLIQGD